MGPPGPQTKGGESHEGGVGVDEGIALLLGCGIMAAQVRTSLYIKRAGSFASLEGCGAVACFARGESWGGLMYLPTQCSVPPTERGEKFSGYICNRRRPDRQLAFRAGGPEGHPVK